MTLRDKIKYMILHNDGLFWQTARKLFTIYLSFRMHDKTCSFGDKNQDKTVFIVGPGGGYTGLFAQYLFILARLYEANALGYHTVVDLSDAEALKDENIGDNPWEYYFKQPSEITLDEARQSKNVLLAQRYIKRRVQTLMDDAILRNDPNALACLQHIAAHQMPFNDKTREYLEYEWDRVRPTSGPILAVMSRGTDHNKLKPKFHAIQPSPDELIEKTKDILENIDVDHIYLKTEERAVVELFKHEFGDKVFYFNSEYFDEYTPEACSQDGAKWIGEYIKRTSKRSVYFSNLEYIRAIYGASQCDYLLAGYNSGTTAAILLNNNRYKQKHIIFKGIY